MLNRKGQGLTEYGIILLLILGIGTAVWFHWNIKDSLGTIYSTIGSDVKSIAGEAYGYVDDLESVVVKRNWDNKGNIYKGPLTFHKTSLSFAGKGYNGSKDINNGNPDDTSIWWFINSSGYKEYKVGKANAYDSGMLQEVPKYLGKNLSNRRGYDITADETYTYFKATDGNTYQVTYYKANPKGTTITPYTGDTSKIDYVTSDYTGYPANK